MHAVLKSFLLNAEIITIGDEILIGQITDTNSQWIATELNKIGISVYQITSIQDKKSHILKALSEAEFNANIVILTGGLGPTKDDITKYAIAEYFNSDLELNEEIVEHIRIMFEKIGYEFTELNKQQALLPLKAKVLKNYLGTASGMWFEKKGKIVVSLPGVPNEMKGLMLRKVLPKLQESFDLPYIIHKTILTYGMGESKVAERIEGWENNLPQFIKLAYLPDYGRLRLRLTAKGTNEGILQKSLNKEVEKLTKLINDIIVGYDKGESLEAEVGKLLVGQGKTLSIAESCTGGNVAKMITSVPGSSKYFIGSITSYNERIKSQFLKVSKEIIAEHSVVSAQVAEAMALGIQKAYLTDYSIAITGNAGPTKDNTDASVGKVFIAIASPSGIYVKDYQFGQPRQKVIQKASVKSLELLKISILKNN